MATLEAEVAHKLAQVKLLVAEKEVLQARERALTGIVDISCEALGRLATEGAAAAEGRAAAGASLGRTLSGLGGLGLGGGEQQAARDGDGEGNNGGGGGPSCPHAPLPPPPPPPPPPPAGAPCAEGGAAAADARRKGILGRYRAYMDFVRARARCDGSIAPLDPGHPRGGEARGVLGEAMRLPRDEAYALLAFNLDKGAPEAPPSGHLLGVARRLRLK